MRHLTIVMVLDVELSLDAAGFVTRLDPHASSLKNDALGSASVKKSDSVGSCRVIFNL